jgi:hypothetical protein
MIGNITIGTNHSNCLAYDDKKDAELISTNCASNDYKQMSQEMETVAASNTRCKNNVVHISMSAPEGEKLSNSQWQQAGEIAMKELGFTDKNQFAITKHTDAGHDHIHITVNRIDSDGKAWNDSRSFERTHQAMRKVEKEMGLERIEDHQNSNDGRFMNTKTALNDSLKASKGKGLDHFKGEMKARGYTVIENKAKTGRISGLSIQDDETKKTYKASELRKGGYRGMEKDLDKAPSKEQSHSNGGNSGAAGKASARGVSKGISKIGGMSPVKMPKMLPKSSRAIINSIISAANQSIKKTRELER